MKNKEKLLNKLIESLNNEPDKWTFEKNTTTNSNWGVELWIANIPILDLHVCSPSTVTFSLMQKIRLYRAMSECRAASILMMNSNL